MAFPADAVPVAVEIAPGADPAANPGTWLWQDVTSRVRVNDRIEIVTGRQNEASLIDPSRCTLTLDNASGDFTPRNPYGQWYGRLGRNTPLRVRIAAGRDGFGRTASNGWGTADSGQVWTVGAGAVSEFAVSGGTGRHTHSAANVLRRTVLATSVLDVEQVYDVATPALLTGAALVSGAVARYGNGGQDYYWLRAEFNGDATTVMLKIAKCIGGGFTDLATLPAVPGLTYAAGVPLRVRAQVLGNRLSIKAWTASGAEPAGWQLETTDDSISTAGQVGLQTWLVLGNTNTLPLAVSFDNYSAHVDRFSGFVSSWPPRWDPTGNESTVAVQADGVMRRLSQGSPALRSPWRRMVTSRARSGLLAYWPCEDGANATSAASALPDGAPMTASSAVRFASLASDLFANSGGVALGFGAGLLPGTASGSRAADVDQGTLTGAVQPGRSSPLAWSVAWMARPVTSGATYSMMRWLTTGGSNSQWEYRHANVSNQSGLWGRRTSDGTWVQYVALFDDSPTLREYRVEAWQDAPNSIGLRLWVDGVQILSGFFVDTLARVTHVIANPEAANPDALAVSHIQVWDTASPPTLGPQGVSSTAQPSDAYGVKVYPYLRWLNEAAHLRLARLCAEDGVQLTIRAVTAVGGTRMGQQPDGTPLDLYRQCETTDQGVLHELGFGLAYLPRDLRYNRPTALTVNYAAGQVAPPFEPVDDDQLLRNRVTVRRIDGSEATAEDAASIAVNGPYEQSVDVNLANDSELPGHASWRLHTADAAEFAERQWLAHHEAGHAVAAVALGVEIAYATLLMGAGETAWAGLPAGRRYGGTFVRTVDPHTDAVVALAGWMATSGHVFGPVHTHDTEAARELVGAAGVPAAMRDAARILDGRRDDVGRVREALLQHGRLDGVQIVALCAHQVGVAPAGSRR
ncbi:hypothetical protein [Micromonospora aurantiaca (nom. illeg.)]|uniref:hypothetical protein n=1 Tax=Micromonospora aurantiaca (nom. illeg.) TaxID=47850 RepID=UPI00340B5059